MGHLVVVANQKGGVGKTTCAVNLAAFGALAGLRTVVVDLDAQGNTSSVWAPDYQGPSLRRGGAPQPTTVRNLAVLPAAPDLLDTARPVGRGAQVGEALEKLTTAYELVVVDCPPSLTELPLAAIAVADLLLIPLQCEYYAMEGLGQILAQVAELQEAGAAGPRQHRILLMMHDPELSLSAAVAQEVRSHLPGQVLTASIPRDPALAVAPSHNRSIVEHEPLSPGGLAFLRATKEILDVLRQRPGA